MAKGTLNKVILIGRLGLDPEIRYTPSGSAIATLSMATNESYKDKNGQQVERTEWHRVVFMNKLAEVLGEYGRKGTLLYVEGKIRTNKWKDATGNDRYTTEIVGDEMQFLGGRGNEGGAGSSTASYDENAPQKKNKPAASSKGPASDYASEAISTGALSPVPEMHDTLVVDDDIPF